MTSAAFERNISWSPFSIAIAGILFAFSTMIAWSYYGLKGWTYLVGESRAADLGFKAVFCLFVVIGCGSAAGIAKRTKQSLGEALREAAGHRGFVLLVSGYFVCGLQVQFIAAHLPAYVTDSGFSAELGAAALGTIGFFNLFGTLAAGRLGDRYRMKYLLSSIYFMRSLVMIAFIMMPISETSVFVFAGAMGLLWLSTIPLTTGLIAHIFGPRYMATLAAIAFLSHQLGAFLGVWMGGVSFDMTGSYDSIWMFAIIAGFAATLIHLPIQDSPIARTAEDAA